MLRSKLAITTAETSYYEFKNMDLGTHTQGSYQNKHKNMSFNANFRIKRGFSSKTHENHFLFLKPTLNRCMACGTGLIV